MVKNISPEQVVKIDVDALIVQMHLALIEYLQQRQIENPLLVGIRTGGVWVADRLQPLLHLEPPIGILDISFYRDDFARAGLNPQVRPSNLPASVSNRHVLLVDDVLYTGRTIRAALNELFDYGRPASVTLAVLIDRGGRELPIQADVVGQRLSLDAHHHIKLSGPERLMLELVAIKDPND